MRQSGSQMETNNRRYSNHGHIEAGHASRVPAGDTACDGSERGRGEPDQPCTNHHPAPGRSPLGFEQELPERSVDMCPLAGSLTEPGLYLTLVRWWPGYMSAPHTYVTDRLCVVVSGTWWCNSGDDFDPASCVPVPAGSL